MITEGCMAPEKTVKLWLIGLCFLGLHLFTPQSGFAQEGAEQTDAAGDSTQIMSEQIMSVIKIFFDGLAEKDSVAMMSVTEPGARLVITSSRADGTPVMRSIPMTEFVKIIVSQEGNDLAETYWDPAIRVHDNLATVWLNYNFYVGDQVDHCGEDAFQLFRSEAGWKIIAIADTQRRTGCDAENG